MLVLTRKKEQTIVLNEDIEITILDIQGDQVRLGISAPKSVAVHRKEIFLEIKQENKKAADISTAVSKASLEDIFKKSAK